MLKRIIEKNKNIFILRNNDLGDVLVATPLLRAIKEAFPNSKVSIGVGDWARQLLENNPHIDEIISCNAPWHNKQICMYPANSLKTFFQGLLYILFSKETKYLYKKRFTHGIDFLGSRQGSWLMLRAGIPTRFGVKGYAGGHNWCTKTVQFKSERNVAKSGLSFLKLFDKVSNVEPRPAVFLTDKEKRCALDKWNVKDKYKIVIAPGGGFQEKCWGNTNFEELVLLLLGELKTKVFIVGTKEDYGRINIKDNNNLSNYCGKFTIRETAAIISASDLVITNSSLCMHLSAAFKRNCITVLGDWYESTKLHFKQWGYPEGLIIGKEKTDGIINTANPRRIFEIVRDMMILR